MSESFRLNNKQPSFSELQTYDTNIYSQANLHYGKMHVYMQDILGKPRIFIGPHWWCSLIGMILLSAVALTVAVILWPLMNVTCMIIYFGMYGFSMLMYVILVLSDPGVIAQKLDNRSRIDYENRNLYECERCLSLTKQRAVHCDFCDVCIDRHDHHCVWLGKCVGSKNLVIFYVFVMSIPAFFACMIFMACYLREGLNNSH